MNIFFITLIIFVFVYIFLNWFAKTSTKKISGLIRLSIIILSMFLALIMAYAGRYIFSLPFILAILPLIKTKAGISLFQIFRLWGLFRVLRNSGRFNFNNFNQNINKQSMPVDEAYRILNLDPNKKYTKDDILKSYKKIMKKIHPDISPELNRLASIVNEAKELLIKYITE
jgi:DnaJ-class molecular chaperone with C-terminal Zn finger domain